MITRALLLIAVMATLAGADESKQPTRSAEWYAENYCFFRQARHHHTFESEFVFPEGYQRVDSASMTDFQFWVSHLPLWHDKKPVSQRYRVKYETSEISRALHFPWRTLFFEDYRIPVQLWFEYYASRGRPNGFLLIPKQGDTLTYAKFLSSDPMNFRGVEVRLQPAERRAPSEAEEDKFVDLCARWTNIPSLKLNCDPVSADSLLPGDLLLAVDSTGRNGRAWVVLVALEKEGAERLYTVGTGCFDKPCDFHIPLFGTDRNYPWISIHDVAGLADGFQEFGFYRPRIR